MLESYDVFFCTRGPEYTQTSTVSLSLIVLNCTTNTLSMLVLAVTEIKKENALLKVRFSLFASQLNLFHGLLETVFD